MPPRPQFGLRKRVKVTTIPPSKKRRKSFFEEYYYGVLVAEFVLLSLLVGAGGMGFFQGVLVGMLVTATTAVGWQFFQYSRFKDDPAERESPKPKPAPLKDDNPNPDFVPIRPAPRKPAPVGPDGKKKFPPSYFPPLRDRKPQ